MKKKRRWMSWMLVLFGICLSAYALISLIGMPDTLQYAVVAPSGEKAADELKKLVEMKEDIDAQLIDCAAASAIGGTVAKGSVSAGEGSVTAAVYPVGEGWFEVYPVFLTEGRRIMEAELERGERVAMLDESAAFKLFGSPVPENAKVNIGGTEYKVIGTFRHGRSFGESAEYAAYIPLLSAKTMAMDALTFSMKPIANSGAGTQFETTLRTYWPAGGSYFDLSKEAMRAMIIVRLFLLVFGLSVLMALLRFINAHVMAAAGRFRSELKHVYFRSLLLRLAGGLLLGALAYGLWAALLYGLMSFSIQPLYVFTEWVPENIVELSSLKKVFWSLVSGAAVPVRVITREMHVLTFYGALLRWGMISLLCGTLLVRRRRAQ